MSSKLIELRKSPSPALVEQILKLEDFKDIKQHIVSTTVTESQMTTKYLKNVSTMLAVVSAVTEVDLDHINYSRHNMYSHVYLNNLLRREKSIWYSASGSGVSFITVHIHHCSHSDLAAHYLNKETKRTVGLFRSSFIRHPYSKRIDKN